MIKFVINWKHDISKMFNFQPPWQRYIPTLAESLTE